MATAVNEEGSRHVAEGCRRARAGLIYLSTDFVFDGAKQSPYVETDPAAPLSVYGRSKLGGEQAVQAIQGYFAAVGVKAKIQTAEWAVYNKQAGAFQVQTMRLASAGNGERSFPNGHSASPKVRLRTRQSPWILRLARNTSTPGRSGGCGSS